MRLIIFERFIRHDHDVLALNRFFRGVFIVVVADHDVRPAHNDFADGIARQFVAVFIGDFPRHTVGGLAD